MDKKQLMYIADHLDQLANGVIQPLNQDSGICYELHRKVVKRVITREIKTFLIRRMWEWSEFSGNNDYPVPHESQDPHIAYQSSDNMWIGDYGDARKRLCIYLAYEAREAAWNE